MHVLQHLGGIIYRNNTEKVGLNGNNHQIHRRKRYPAPSKYSQRLLKAVPTQNIITPGIQNSPKRKSDLRAFPFRNTGKDILNVRIIWGPRCQRLN